MDNKKYLDKFGDNYRVNEQTYKLGIDIRYSVHLAKRFTNRIVLETCTGGGFTAISIAKYAKHLFTVEIDKNRYLDAVEFSDLPEHECEKLFSNGNLNLYCLHFGNLKNKNGVTEFYL